MNEDCKNPHADESGPRLNDNQIDTYCLDWVRWCDTRKFYLRPAAQNILARMQPSKDGSGLNMGNGGLFCIPLKVLIDPRLCDDAHIFKRLCTCFTSRRSSCSIDDLTKGVNRVNGEMAVNFSVWENVKAAQSHKAAVVKTWQSHGAIFPSSDAGKAARALDKVPMLNVELVSQNFQRCRRRSILQSERQDSLMEFPRRHFVVFERRSIPLQFVISCRVHGFLSRASELNKA